MSLSTIIHAGMRQYERPPLALVLMGGGARTAYQVGVLRALATLLQSHPGVSRSFPFQILVGTSAGAINAAFLAGRAREGLQAFEELAVFWGRLRSIDVYRLNTRRWLRFSRVALALELSRYIQLRGALLDNTPLAELLRQGISLGNIENALRSKTIDALAVTGSSYTSGVHWTFCQTASRETFQPWTSPGRRAEFQPLTIAHLMASSAIPFLFPATALTVEGREEYFGDGSMRQITPLSLDALALQYTDELPATIRDALGALGMLRGGGGALASYLLFEQGFVQSLMALGRSDATTRAAELIELITGP